MAALLIPTASPDAGLGLFEYMLLAEELDAEPIWVINNGISHIEDIPTSQIGPWVQVTPCPFKLPCMYCTHFRGSSHLVLRL